MSPRMYVDAALYVGSDLDLGNASDEELRALMAEAIASGFGWEVTA